MNRQRTRWMSFLLAVIMILTMLPPVPLTVRAAENSLEGKTISILGDSISTFAGYIPTADGTNLEHKTFYPKHDVTSADATWWIQTATILNAKLGVNDSWSGSRVLNTIDGNSGNLGEDAAMASLTRIRNLGSNGTPDVILFFGGTNDIAFDSPLGSFDPTAAPTEADLTATKWTTYADAYTAAIMRMQHYYPKAQILCIFPTENQYYYDAQTRLAYTSVMADICDHYGVGYLDPMAEGFDMDSMLGDVTHPNAAGMTFIAGCVARKLLGEHTHSFTASVTAPTCTEQGYTTYTCACGDSYMDDYTDAVGHSYDSIVCTVCGNKYPDKITELDTAFAVTMTPENYLTISNPSTEKLACAPVLVAYGDGNFAVAYLADDVNTVETESSTTIVCRLCLFDVDSPDNGTFFDIATAGQTIGSVTIGSKAPYEPNLLKLSDDALLVLFNIRDTAGNYVYYSASFDTASNTVTSYQPLTLDGKSWTPANIAASYNALAESDISTSGPSGSMVFTSQIIQHEGYYYGYCGGICSGFGGMLVRSTDGINWTSVMAPEALSEMAGVIECGFEFLDDYVYFCMRDISSGVYHCSYNFSTGEQSAKTVKIPGLTTSKPAAFTQDGKLYVIVNKATGDDNTVGRRNTALFYLVDPETCRLTLARQVFCTDGCAYHSVENFNGINYWSFHTDARRINPYSQGRSNLAFREIPELYAGEGGSADGVLDLDDYSYMFASGCITVAANVWQSGVVNWHYQIPLADFADFDTVSITANSEQKAYIAFFTDWMTQAGTIAYAEGWTEQLIMEPGTVQTLTIPEDAAYLYILNNNAAGANLLPESVVFNKTETEQHTHAYATTVTAPTCTEQGYTTYTCGCGDRYVDSYVKATGHSYANGTCTVCGIRAGDSGLTHAVPESQGVRNAIARAYLLTDVEWTPLADVPGVQEIGGEYTVVPFKAGVTYKGIPYSGVTANDCYVGLNVNLDSFLTALKNENSVLYTKNLFSTNPKSATYFGTVCSKFAQYVLDVPGSYNTNNVANIPGMDTIALPGEYTVDQIKLGDVVLNTATHTTVCTDILYDAEGNVAFIEISEAVMPLVRRMLWSPAEFYEHFADYRLCRYQYIDVVPAPDTPAPDSGYALMPRYGDKYNYRVSGTKGIVDILEEGYYKAVILRDGVVVDEIVLNGDTFFRFDRSVPGYLEMYLEKEDGSRSGSVHACVVESTVIVTDCSRFTLGELTVTIDGSCGTPVYVQVGSAHAIFCNVEGLEGSIALTFPTSRISTQQVRVAYQNEYGIYLSSWVPFTADTNPSDDPLLSQGQYWNGYNITPNSPTPVIQENKQGYWSYTMVPVAEQTTYYSEGATRMWFLDENGSGISTFNAYRDSEIPFRFTTPAETAYVSIAYSPDLVEQGTETLTHVHQYQSVITAPTCTEQGYTTHTCTQCGSSYVDNYVDAAGHRWGDWEVVMEPTVTDPGIQQRTCVHCDETELEEIPRQEISYGDVNSDGKVNTLDLIMLRQYLAGWDVELDTAAADINGHGTVNTLDLIILRQYLAGWDVPLGPKED